MVDYFHDASDPYSHLVAQVLPQFLARYDIELVPHLVSPPPDWAALEKRLIGRGTESADVMARRLQTARAELAAQGDFDEVVVNSQLESACAELVSLLVAHTSVPRDRL